MDEELVKEFRRLMEDKTVSDFLLAVFVEWVRKRGRGTMGRYSQCVGLG
jgi:hypothetical protein